jgi:hypothetical protein
VTVTISRPYIEIKKGLTNAQGAPHENNQGSFTSGIETREAYVARSAGKPNGGTTIANSKIQIVGCVRGEIKDLNNRWSLQVKVTRALPGGAEFVAYLDAIGEVDGIRCLIDWKTTTSRYPEGLDGLLSLDPQLICYSWISGISEVALVVFVRKHVPEIQYLRTSISEEQRREFGRQVETTISQVESSNFDPHSGIRFPQNGCMSCSHLGLCLNNELLVAANLIRKAGASDLDWLDELVD